MLIFSIVALLMLFVALAFVVVPLLRERPSAEPVSDMASNVAIYKSQRRELDDELARGAISEAEHGAAVGELSARVVDEVPEQSSADLLQQTKPHGALSRCWRLRFR